MSVAKIWTGRCAAGAGQALLEQDGHRVGLLAGGAAGHPHPDRLGAVRVRQQPRDDLGLEGGERLRIAEEPGDADQQLAEQQLGLVRQRPQLLDIAGNLIGLQHMHPALNAAQQGAGLVLAEVAAEPAVQHRADRRQMVRKVLTDAIRTLGGIADGPVVPVLHQGGWHCLYGASGVKL